MRTQIRRTGFGVVMLLALSCAAFAGSVDDMLGSTGVKGGLVVVLGADADLLEGFGKREGFLVQGLDADRDRVLRARGALHAKGIYGPVTVKHWTGKHLPFADGVVNLFIADQDGQVSRTEIERVLAPRGVAMVAGKKTVKPVPGEIDEWTHYLHGADNNAVAMDSKVGPPRYLKWTAGPKYSRNHEIDSSVVALVSAQGRFFYVVDEGPPGFMGKYLPQQWALVARDAFNGVILWKKPMPEMGWTQWKPVMRNADWAKLVAQRRLIPITLPRRVVAVGERVYAVLSYHAPLTVLDAVTGDTIRTVEGTKGADEVLFHDDTLYLSVRPQSRGSLDKKEDTLAIINRNDKTLTNHPGTVMAVDPGSGKILWNVPSPKLLPMSLTACGERVFYHTGDELVCLNRKTGKEQWRTPNGNATSFRWNVSHTLVVHDDVLLVATPKKLEAFDGKSGKLLWEGKGGRSGFAGANPVNVYVIDGLVWSPAGAKAGSVAEGRDLRTGEVKRTIELPQFMYTGGHHFRCYRGKATEKFLLENKRGIEMIDLGGENFLKNDWVRGICRYGILPCNGLIYSTPTPCSCYPAAQLTGFNALAPTRQGGKSGQQKGKRLEKGPAFAEASAGKPAASTDWPQLRNGSRRSGISGTVVGMKPEQKWKVELGGKLSQPIVADGRLFVASVHEHTVHAVDTGTGKALWNFTVDGRVDSPPTYSKGMLYFGSANGWLYCLRASDGEMAWRYRVAPGDDQIVSYNQLESVWPLHGSALVMDDVVYAAAGRNSYLDGGIFMVGLDAATGEKLHEANLKHDQQDPAVDKGAAHVMEGGKLDVLASDGTHITMQGAVFDRTLRSVSDGANRSLGIYASAGFLDDLAWNRNAWRCGNDAASLSLNKKNLAGMSHTGQILVVDDKLVYGVKYFLGHSGQSAVFYPGEDGYKLFAHPVAEIGGKGEEAGGKKKRKKKGDEIGPLPGGGWELMLPVRVRAMTKAGEVLFVAGAPDIVDKDDPLGALEGRMGAVLRIYSAVDGKELNEIKLKSPPVFDGLIAADGRLFMSAMDGSVICLGE